MTNWCTDNRSLLEARIASNKNYLTMLTLAIDKQIYLWLCSCCHAVNIQKTKMDLMNFNSITSSIELNNFYCSIPPSVKPLKNKSLEDNEPSQTQKEKACRRSKSSE